MKKNRFKSEVSYEPERLNLSSDKQGAAAALSQVQEKKPVFDNVSIEMMRDNPLYSKLDDIDKVGVAQQKVMESAKIVEKSKFVRQLNRKMNHGKIPTSNNLKK